MSVHTLSRIATAKGGLSQAEKHHQLRNEGACRSWLKQVRDLIDKELGETAAPRRRGYFTRKIRDAHRKAGAR